MRKNKDYNPCNCPVTHVMNQIGGTWKILIMYAISKKCNRFSQLQKALPLISKQMLATQLRELEEDGILVRAVISSAPSRVDYALTRRGESLMPVIMTMQEWGLNDLAGRL